jgi:undecaprenyl-diphosphatase
MGAAVRRRADAFAALVALLVYLACVAVVAGGGVPQLEQDVFHAVNNLPDAVRLAAYPVQLLGLLLLPLAIAAVAAVLRLWRLAIALALLPLLKYGVEFQVVKKTVDRARPFESTCAVDPACGNFRDVPLHGPSFVSGHAIIAGALVVLLLPYLRRPWDVTVLGLAIAVCVARVYLGAHNPLDVVGGAAVGVVLGSLLNLAIGIRPRRDPAGRR